MLQGKWFWMVVDGFGCLQMVLGGFRWFSVICSCSNYCQLRCLKFKRSTQLLGVFVVSSNNEAKVPLKQMTMFLGNSAYKVSLKRPWVGERSFVLWKLTYIALCKFSPFWLRFSPFWGIFSRISSFGLLLVGSLYSRLSIQWYSCLLKRCCNYIFQVSILSISTKVLKGNYNLWTFLKSLETSGKNQILIKEPWMYVFVKSRNFEIFSINKIMTLSKFARK